MDPMIGSILAILKSYGPGAVFVALWWFERSERKDAQKELSVVSRDTITALNELKGLIDQLSNIFKIDRRSR